MSGRESPVKTIDAVPASLKADLDRWIASSLRVDAAKFNGALLRHKAVVAGSFCIPPVAAFLHSPVRVSPSDVDVWVAIEDVQGLLSDLKTMLQSPPSWFSQKSPPVEIRSQNFELSQYRRLREDVDGIFVISTWRSQPRVRRLLIQILVCRNLSRALASFDLNVCAVAWTGAALQIWAPHVLSGIRDGIVTVNSAALARQNASELRRTLLRVRKYTRYGFRLDSVQPLVTALHEHFGMECSEGTMLCENYMAYFMDRDRRIAREDEATLGKQEERARLARLLLRRVKV